MGVPLIIISAVKSEPYHAKSLKRRFMGATVRALIAPQNFARSRSNLITSKSVAPALSSLWKRA